MRKRLLLPSLAFWMKLRMEDSSLSRTSKTTTNFRCLSVKYPCLLRIGSDVKWIRHSASRITMESYEDVSRVQNRLWSSSSSTIKAFFEQTQWISEWIQEEVKADEWNLVKIWENKHNLKVILKSNWMVTTMCLPDPVYENNWAKVSEQRPKCQSPSSYIKSTQSSRI